MNKKEKFYRKGYNDAVDQRWGLTKFSIKKDIPVNEKNYRKGYNDGLKQRWGAFKL